jgi:dolichyl-phosphate beta-glucosyltransferase
MDISIVIPAYNEEKRIKKTLKKVAAFFDAQHLDYEIIVVSDGSKDKTCEVVENFGSRRVRIISVFLNHGKGFGVNRGMGNAKGEKILFIDADNSTPIEQFLDLDQYIDEYDIVIGSRYLHDSKIKLKQPWIRIIGSRIGNLLVQMMILPGFSDTQCGFKLFTKEAAKHIFPRQTVWRWGFDMEILYIAKKLKYKIKQVPVSWFNDERSKIQSFKTFLTTLAELVKIKINVISGAYNLKDK